MTQFDLLRVPGLRALLSSRWPLFLLRAAALGFFTFAILAGLVGTPVGSRNFSIVFVWILWWAALILVAVPFFGRGWCAVCPIPMPGEWLQQGALLGPTGRRGLGLGRRWPKALRNIWVQNAAFALMAAFSAVILTQPRVTALVLAGLLALALGTSLVYERRAFCRYLCPVGGFIGLYAQASPLELRVKETAVCASHTTKTCYTGSEAGFGCPWGAFPGGMVRNNVCGLCMECLRTCPMDNIALNLRRPGSDLAVPRGRKMDEAFKAFLLVGSAMAYSAVMVGPWGELKEAAYSVGTAAWGAYVLAFLIFTLGLLPATFWLASWAGGKTGSGKNAIRQRFVAFAYALVPMGLAAWIAFSLSFVFANLSYLLPVVSDPLGWGWDLLGTAAAPWVPYLTSMVPVLQILVLALGLAWTGKTVVGIGREFQTGRNASRLVIPILGYGIALTAGMLWLLVG